MADMANVALKHGYYFEASENDDWIDYFCETYNELKDGETKLAVGDDYSHNFDPFVKFLRIIKDKKKVF